MGMEMICGNFSVKIGSYGKVENIRYYLLVSIKEYLEIYSMYDSNNDERVNYIVDLLGEKQCINYYKHNSSKENLFLHDDLDGFFSFIFNLPNDNGKLSSDDARRFYLTFEKINECIKPNLKRNIQKDMKLYNVLSNVNEELIPIIQESINSGNELTFFKSKYYTFSSAL